MLILKILPTIIVITFLLKQLVIFQEALAKIKTVLVDEKKHIRFGDWSAAEVCIAFGHTIY